MSLVSQPACRPHLLSATGSLENVSDRGRERLRIPGFDDIPRDAVNDLVGHTGDTSRHHRTPGRHRFQDDDREIFVPDRWKDDEVSRGVESPGVVVFTEQADAMRDVL